MEVVRGVTCTPGFLLLGAALALLDGEGVLPWALLAAAVHELGHYTAVRLQGGAVKGLHLTISGGEMTLDRRRPLTYAGELAAILAGPGVSLVLAWAALRLGEEGWLLAGLSLGQGAFNLLPLPVLDGGRALEALAGRRVSGVLAAVTGLLLITAGVCLLVQYENPTLLLTGLWLTLPAGRWKREKIPCNWGKGVIEYRSLNKGWSSAAAVRMRKRDGRDGRYERL